RKRSARSYPEATSTGPSCSSRPASRLGLARHPGSSGTATSATPGAHGRSGGGPAQKDPTRFWVLRQNRGPRRLHTIAFQDLPGRRASVRGLSQRAPLGRGFFLLAQRIEPLAERSPVCIPFASLLVRDGPVTFAMCCWQRLGRSAELEDPGRRTRTPIRPP